MEANKRLLLIVDPQIDFISGSLAVKDADKAMDYLAGWMASHRSEYDEVMVTQDWHPANHCSFKEQGGTWPSHCVADTEGASVYPAIVEELKKLEKDGVKITYRRKAVKADHEQYSAFEEGLPEGFDRFTKVIVSGIAGNYCVKYSVEDIIKHNYNGEIEHLKKAIPFI